MAMTTGPLLNQVPGTGKAREHINLSEPSGWVLLYWVLSVLIIAVLFLTI